MTELYIITWTQISGGAAGDGGITALSTVNMTNFDLYLNAEKVSSSDVFVACRVNIQHDPTTKGSYCGPKIAVAGMCISVTAVGETLLSAYISEDLTSLVRTLSDIISHNQG